MRSPIITPERATFALVILPVGLAIWVSLLSIAFLFVNGAVVCEVAP